MRDDVLEPAPVRAGSNEALSIDLTQEFVCSAQSQPIAIYQSINMSCRDGKAW